MRHWRITTKIWAIVALTLLLGAAAGSFLFQRLESIVSVYETLFDHNMRNQDVARVMQLSFKKQVQEWKDTLLRGRDTIELKKHSRAFREEARRCRR